MYGEWASSIRRSVFVKEQGIDESEEWDEYDSNSQHVVAWLGNTPVGTARLLPEGKIGRMAVLSAYRGQGVGAAMLLALIALAKKQNMPVLRLSAQQHALGFYLRHGFVPDGPAHIEVDIPHQWMGLHLTA